MRMYSKDIRILIGVVFIVCVVGGAMAFQSTFAKSTINQSPTNPPHYPENENRQTYGSAEEATSVAMLPDLIHVGSMNGIAG